MLSKNEIKYIQSLKAKKQRHEAGVFIAEGPKIIEELIRQHAASVIKVFGLLSFFKEIPSSVLSKINHVVISEAELERISMLQAPQQCLALVHLKEQAFEPFVAGSWSLMLDSIQDPGNLGTIIRIADWFGIEHIYASADTADCFNPKVVQATMGSLFRVKMMYGPCEQWLQTHQPACYITAMQGKSIWETDAISPGVIIIGNEGKGVSAALAAHATGSMSIPKLGGAESLNAAVATGIILSHVLQP
ncbi:MAG TPA: RNA methyltransferase [Phnomibacter sp.]|nr:RNA methyltransferase [Phnomibacter sp.]